MTRILKKYIKEYITVDGIRYFTAHITTLEWFFILPSIRYHAISKDKEEIWLNTHRFFAPHKYFNYQESVTDLLLEERKIRIQNQKEQDKKNIIIKIHKI